MLPNSIPRSVLTRWDGDCSFLRSEVWMWSSLSVLFASFCPCGYSHTFAVRVSLGRRRYEGGEGFNPNHFAVSFPSQQLPVQTWGCVPIEMEEGRRCMLGRARNLLNWLHPWQNWYQEKTARGREECSVCDLALLEMQAAYLAIGMFTVGFLCCR